MAKFKVIAAIATFVALTLPAQLAAQQRYKLVDLGTFGGPNGVVNGPGLRDLSQSGAYAGYAETAIPDPYAPNCQNPECLVYHAQVWRNGVVMDFGSLPGINNSGASTISANGNFVSGGSENSLIDPLLGVPENRAVFWTIDGHIHELELLPGGTESFGAFVNSKGQVTGSSNNTIPDPFSMNNWGTQTRAVLWQNGTIKDIGTLGGPDATVQAINERGQISGQSYTNSIPNGTTGIPTVHPSLWSSGQMADIGDLGGTFGITNSSNDNGQVVGIMTLPGDVEAHPFFWHRGALTDIGTFGGSNGEALRVSDSGFVVGIADFHGDFIHHAFVWKDGTMKDVGVVPGDLCTDGLAINSAGQAVGTSTNCMGNVQHLFLWQSGTISDLTGMILPGSENIQLVEVWDINDRGDIAAVGVLPNGDTHAVLLIPASSEEIAAAANLPQANGANNASRRPATTSADLPWKSRNRLLNPYHLAIRKP